MVVCFCCWMCLLFNGLIFRSFRIGVVTWSNGCGVYWLYSIRFVQVCTSCCCFCFCLLFFFAPVFVQFHAPIYCCIPIPCLPTLVFLSEMLLNFVFFGVRIRRSYQTGIKPYNVNGNRTTVQATQILRQILKQMIRMLRCSKYIMLITAERLSNNSFH